MLKVKGNIHFPRKIYLCIKINFTLVNKYILTKELEMTILEVIPFIKHFHNAAYWFAFISALLESFVGIGLIIPGSTIILILGGLASEGYFDIGDLIFFVITGAILGNTINYYFGKKFKTKFKMKENFFIRPALLNKAKLFFEKHGAKSVFIGRFIPSLRETITFIAGLTQMKARQFFIWSTLGAFAWAGVLCLSGYFFNSYLKISKLVLTRSGIFILIILLVFTLFYLLKKFIIKNGMKIVNFTKSVSKSIKTALSENIDIQNFLKKHNKIFTILSNRLNKDTFFGLPFTLLICSLFYITALFGGIIEDLINSDAIVFADVRVVNLLKFFRNEGLNKVFLWITLLGKFEVVLILSFVVSLILWISKERLFIIPFLGGILGSSIFSYFGKIAFHRPRPNVAIYLEKTYSFPSGHAAISIALYGFITYLLIKNIKKWTTKVNVFFTGVLLILLIGFSRLYLGVHYISDVWGGYLIGGIWLIVAIGYSEYLHFNNYKKEALSSKKLYLSVGLVSFFFLSYLIIGMNYTPLFITPSLTKLAKVDNPLAIFNKEHLKYTETILGVKQEPISFIVLAKNDFELMKSFSSAGWFLADDLSVLNLLKAEKSMLFSSPYPTAPVSPYFWNIEVNNFAFEKPFILNNIKMRHHTRFWKTNYVSSAGQQIYVGVASFDDVLKWGITHKISPNIDEEREILFADLLKSGTIKEYEKKKLINPELGKNFFGDPFFTDGQVVIISLK